MAAPGNIHSGVPMCCVNHYFMAVQITTRIPLSQIERYKHTTCINKCGEKRT